MAVQTRFDTLLNGAITDVQTTCVLDAAPAFSTGFGTIERGTASEEDIYWGNVAGLQLTGMLRGLSKTALTVTEVAGNKKPHLDNKQFEGTLLHYIINNKADLDENEAISGTWTFNTALPTSTQTPSANAQLTTKVYVDTADLLKANLAGGNTFSGNQVFADNTAQTTTNAAPTSDKILANKKYVDDQVASVTDTKVKASATDTTPGTLDAKSTVGTHLSIVVVNPAGNEQRRIDTDAIQSSTVAAGSGNKIVSTKTSDGTLDPSFYSVSGTAGESITGATTPQPVCIGSSDYTYQPFPSDLHLGTTGVAANIGDVDATTREAFKIVVTDTLATSITVANVKISINKSGAPVDDTYIEIQTDTAGSPSGTVVTDGTSSVVNGAALSVTNKFTTYTFATPPTITSGTTYWAVIRRSGANNAGNYYQIQTKANTSAFSGNSKTYTASTGLWADAGTQVSNLTTFTKSYGGRVYLSDADNKPMCRCDGFATTTATAGNPVVIQPTNIISGLSGKTPGKMQYVSTAAGTLTESPTATTNAMVVSPVGKAFSATTVNINPGTRINRGTLSSLTFAGAVANTTDFFIETGFRPTYVRLGVNATETGATPLYYGSITAIEGTENQELHITKNSANGDGNVGTGVTGIIIDTAVSVGSDRVSVGTINDNGFFVTYLSNAATSIITTLDWVAMGN